MIHFAIGTKAQFIKMAPIMHLLHEEGEPYHLLDLSQHGSLTGKILTDFGLSPVVTRLGEHNKSVTTYMQAVKWLALGFGHILFNKHEISNRLFLNAPGVVLIHGDTLSTLLGHYLAKAAGLKTALVEAGLSSGNFLDPFPEEWIRRHIGKKTDYLFAPDETSETWLRQHKLKGQTVNTGYNTGRDALYLIRDKFTIHDSAVAGDQAYGIVTLHRLETISRKRRLRRAVAHIVAMSEAIGPLHFYMHPPTENALKAAGLMNLLTESRHITVRGLAPYPSFMQALSRARFVLTDGGSIQEEASYLGKPCLLLRNRTERKEGIGKNAILSTWSVDRDASHLLHTEEQLMAGSSNSSMEASRIILTTLKEFRTGKHI